MGRALVKARRQYDGERGLGLHRAFRRPDRTERGDPPFPGAAQSEAIRIGEARGYRLEEIDHLPPETIARAGEGDAAALKIYDERRLSRVGRGSPDQRPSMGQDMAKGRRTEIENLNGFVVREGEQVGLQARANERLVDIVKRVERGELQRDPRHITDLRLN
jgi:2-dehydropantoate 2-reductase